MTDRRSYRVLGAEIIASLMHSPRTWQDVCASLSLSNQSGDGWLKALRAAGVIRVSGFVKTGLTTRMKRVYSLQISPHALPDEKYPRAPAKPKRDRIPRKPKPIANSVFDLGRLCSMRESA